MSDFLNTKGCDPNNLLDGLIKKMGLKNDAELSRELGVPAPTISKLRHRRTSVGGELLLHLHEKIGLSIKDLRALLGAPVANGESTAPSSTARSSRKYVGRGASTRELLPRWTDGLEIQIAKVLIWKGFRSRADVLAALARDESIDRIGPTRKATLFNWLATGRVTDDNGALRPGPAGSRIESVS